MSEAPVPAAFPRAIAPTGRARLLRRWRILVLGDSHARIFENPRLRRRFPLVRFSVTIVRGATVSGLPNPGSKTRAYPHFKRALDEQAGAADGVITYLGEVDCGFVVWLRARKHGLAVEEMLGQAVERYRAFLAETAGYAPLLVISAPLPTIGDGREWGDVAHLRREVTASQRERTQLTMRFNTMIESFCRQRGHDYLNLDAASSGPDGLVRTGLLHANPLDHHYASAPHADLLATGLQPRLGSGALLLARLRAACRLAETRERRPCFHALPSGASGGKAQWRAQVRRRLLADCACTLTDLSACATGLRLVLGIGRSGTTWIVNTLARSNPDASLFEEPLWRFAPPVPLGEHEEDHTAVPYCRDGGDPAGEVLLLAYRVLASPHAAFFISDPGRVGGRSRCSLVPGSTKVLAKEVHALLATEYLARRLPCRFLLVRRNLVELLDSIMHHSKRARGYLNPEYRFCQESDFLRFFPPRLRERVREQAARTDAMPAGDMRRLLGERMLACILIQEWFGLLADTLDNVTLVDYDVLLQDRDGGFARMAAFLELDYRPGAYHLSGRAHVTRTEDELRNRPRKSLTREEVAWIEDSAAPLLEDARGTR